MDHGVRLRRRQLHARRRRRTNNLAMGGNADHLGQTENIDNAMVGAITDATAAEQGALDRACCADWLGRPNAAAAGHDCESDWPIAGLCRDREIITAK